MTTKAQLKDRAAELLAATRVDSIDFEDTARCVHNMLHNDTLLLSIKLRFMDTAARDHVLDYIDVSLWDSLGFQPTKPRRPAAE